MPRLYADANLQKPKDYWDYEVLNINWGSQDDYAVTRNRIGPLPASAMVPRRENSRWEPTPPKQPKQRGIWAPS